ncbi:hypothetical protein ACIPJS_22440 [Streptomyces sp. NPDC086783]
MTRGDLRQHRKPDLRLTLVPVAGTEQIGDFLLHVEGGTVRFRC